MRYMLLIYQNTEAWSGLPRGDHRPETLMLTRKGEIRLLEVGLTTVARPPYLAPEVWEGGPATPASDVYNLGLFAIRPSAAADPARVFCPSAGQIRCRRRGARPGVELG